jgi:hypothetical protein
VISDIAAAPCFVQLDAASLAFVLVGEDVGPLGGTAERDDVRVLDEK